MPTWKYEGKPLITEISDMPEDTIGFIYKIRKKITVNFISEENLCTHTEHYHHSKVQKEKER